jgi:hypothetical protein
MRVEAVTKVCTLAGHVGLKSCSVCNPTTEKTPSGICAKQYHMVVTLSLRPRKVGYFYQRGPKDSKCPHFGQFSCELLT